MPAIYAHYRFGKLILPALAADVRGQIQRHRRLFDLGLQGPDFLFYYRPFSDTAIARLGDTLHMRSGRDFFTEVCRDIHSDSEEPVLAYLYGLLGHYCLDSLCHPYVNEVTAAGAPSHTALESEFERYLLVMDGTAVAHTHRRSAYLQNRKEDLAVISPFFLGTEPGQIGEAIRSMALFTDLLTCGSALHRALARKILGVISPAKMGLIVPPAPDAQASRYDAGFYGLYEQALARYPQLLEQLRDHLSFREELGSDFEAIFG